ncbi:MAG TPA: redoxin family protein [Chitinophagaceae bacterium]|nr:redoxin family protein [Chitinophagaceae bacterium]
MRKSVTHFFAATMLMLTTVSIQAQPQLRQETIDSLKKAVTGHEEDLPALRQYIQLLGYKNDTVTAQFDVWMKQYPKSAVIPYALGEAYYKAQNRQCITYLMKAWNNGDTTKRIAQMFNIAADENWKLDIPRTPNTIDSLKSIIASNPDSLLPLQQFIFLSGIDNDTTVTQLNKWADEFPKSASFPFALGESYYNAESPKAKPYLLKVITLQPKNAKVYLMLSIDAERWGKNDEAREYMGKAAEADPADPSYTFYYADDFRSVDTAMWHKKTWELVKKFPQSERGAQGLYWLAERSNDRKEKIAIGEQLRQLYPPDKFRWSESGMSTLFDAYLQEGMTTKAIELAKAMAGIDDDFKQSLELANNITAINILAADKKFSEAETKLSGLKVSRYSGAADMVSLLKAQIWDAAGKPQMAYDSLLFVQAKKPSDEIKNAITKYGAELGKTKEQAEIDIWALRDKFTKPAPAFTLGMYTSPKQAKLEDYRGKVVLLTFWFPGCGPCRGEMPHFENVLRKYNRNDIAYLGINVLPNQDEYVLPFMKGTKYSFIPLRGTEQWAEKTYNVRGEPTNFLIDRNGRIVYTNFIIDGNNERLLELMINSLLARKG